MRRDQLLGEAVAVAPRSDPLGAGGVAPRQPLAQLGGEPVEGFARLHGLGARSPQILGSGGEPRLLVAQLARETRDLGEGAVALGFQELEVALERAQLR